MLQKINIPSPVPVQRDVAPAPAPEMIRLFNAARRQYKKVIGLWLIGLGAGGAYAFTDTPLYTAQAQMLIDSQRIGSSGVTEPSISMMFDSGAIDSQVEVFRSERVAYAVANRLRLFDDEDFLKSPWSPLSIIDAAKGQITNAVMLVMQKSTSEKELPRNIRRFLNERAVITKLRNTLEVSRVGRTYVINVEYVDQEPGRAATIANAFADIYIADLLDSKFDATRRSSEWLKERVADLKDQAISADQAVQRFRAQNNLTQAGGVLLSDQQLADVNTQLVMARAETTKLEARFNQIQAIVASGDTGASIAESFGSTIITDLRARYLRAAKSQADVSARFGPDHAQAVNLRNEMKEYEKQIFEELTRISQSVKTELAIARERQKSLESGLSELVGDSEGRDQKLVKLRDLVTEAESYRNLVQTFTARFQESMQKQSFPVTEARVITPATPPLWPSHPRTSILLFGFGFAGILGGIGLGLMSEARDRSFRTGEQIPKELGIELLGLTDIIKAGPAPSRRMRRMRAASNQLVMAPQLQHSLLHPLSPFSETMRSTKISIDIALPDKATRIIGITSIMPGEGKTTIAKNFASHVAHLGSRVLLIDSDLRNPSLSRSLAPHAKEGVVEILLNGRSPFDLLQHEKESGLQVLTIANTTRVTHSSQVISSQAMRSLLRTMSERFDYIILDMPPIAPLVDVKAASDLVDGLVLVIEWGKTKRSFVSSTLELEPQIRRKCVGAILNKVNLRRLVMYDETGSGSEYAYAYNRYYRT